MEPHWASGTADLEAARWDAVEDKIGPVRESCNGVLAGEGTLALRTWDGPGMLLDREHAAWVLGCDEVAKSVERCLGFAKNAPGRRQIDT